MEFSRHSTRISSSAGDGVDSGMVESVELASVVASALTTLVGDVELMAGSVADDRVDSGMKTAVDVELASLVSGEAGGVDVKCFGS